MAESISEGTLKQFSKQVGDHVEQDEEIATIETDKIDVAVNAPKAGVILEFLANEEDNVVVGQDLVKIDAGAQASEGGESKAKEEPKAPASESQETSSQPEGQKEEAKPKQEEKKPEQPKEQPKQESKPAPKQEKTPEKKPAAAEESKPATPGSREERRVKMNRMRLRIAERLKQSQNTAASLTTFNEVDMSGLMEMRKLYKDEILKKTGTKLGFMGAFSKAASLAMKEIPAVNASIEGPNGGDTIVYRDFVDISVAVATPKGLVTPVVRNAESLDMIGIEQEIAALGKKVSFLELSSATPQQCTNNPSPGPRQQAHHRRHGRRHLHHLQRRRLRLPHGHPDHQPAPDRRPRPARHQGQARRHQRQGRDPPHDVPRPDLRPPHPRRPRGRHLPRQDQGDDRGPQEDAPRIDDVLACWGRLKGRREERGGRALLVQTNPRISNLLL